MKSKKWILVLAACCITALCFTGCGQKTATNTTPIRIATKPMTEQYILGEILGQLIENNTDYKVEITKGIKGGTSNIQPAMEKGEFDLYPEYTSSGWIMVLKHKAGEIEDDKMLAALQKEYEEKFNMTWIGLYGFNNTYCVTVDKTTADKYNVKKTSDLTAVADQLVIGVNPDYAEREDGLPALCKKYNINFKEVKDVDIGLKYEALDSGSIQVTNGYTTDAQLATGKYVVLEDDQKLQVNYFASTIIRKEALEAYPGLDKVLEKMDGILTDSEMAALNYKVEVEKQDEKEVAKAFLISKGLIKN